MKELVEEQMPGYGDVLKSVLIAAVAFHRSRHTDIGLLDFALALHLFEGGHGVRAHNGTLYWYVDGAFRPYSGCVSDSALSCIRKKCKYLENVFALLDIYLFTIL